MAPSLMERFFIGDDEIRINLHGIPQAVAFRAGAERIIEGEHSGRQLFKADAAVHASEISAKR